MGENILLCQSLSQAQRASSVLGRAGIHAPVTRIASERTGMGCGFGVRVSRESMERSKEILHSAGIHCRNPGS